MARQDLEHYQHAMHLDPLNSELIDKEKCVSKVYLDTDKAYILFLKQKSKAHWLQDGDSNKAYFHKCIKMRIHRNNIKVICDEAEITNTLPDYVMSAFLAYYQNLLGISNTSGIPVCPDIVKFSFS